MNMKTLPMKPIKFILFLILIAGAQVHAQKAPAVEEEIKELKEENAKLNNRIEKLEGQKENLDDRFKNKSDEINNRVGQIQTKLEKDHNRLEIITWVTGSLALVGIITILLNIFWYTNKVAKQKVDEKFDALFNEKRERLIQLIDAQVEENNLRNEKKIAVISHKDSDEGFIKSFFGGMEFKHVQYLAVEQYERLTGDFDLIFFNNEDKKMSVQIMQQYVAESNEKTMCFSFSALTWNDLDSGNEKVAFANRRTQLYPNLINALKYQDLIERI